MCVISLYRSFRNRSTPPSNIFSLKLIKFLIFLCCQGCIPETAHHSNVVYPSFTNMPSTTGINFAHNSGAFGAHWLPETMGAGCCWLDYDGDGWQDLFFVNGRDWTEVEVNEFVAMAERNTAHKSPPTSEIKEMWSRREKKNGTCTLFRNNRDGTFTDVTLRVGLAVSLYGMGCCPGDYDNDGDVDLYITALGSNRLFRNDEGKFVDVTTQAQVGDKGFSSSAAWLDYDLDADLDLFVCNYVQWDPGNDIWYSLDGASKTYPTPQRYFGESSRLYRNNGNGLFEDATNESGVHELVGKALGVVVFDYNDDGWPDILVACDTEYDLLYRNNGNGTFDEVGVIAGIAVSNLNAARAGMGIDAADYNNAGRMSVLIGNFSDEMFGLYHNDDGKTFRDVALESGLGRPSKRFLTFGCFFFDYDNDGWTDVFAANGHLDPIWESIRPDLEYAQRPLLFRNKRNGTFTESGRKSGLNDRFVARGTAYADYDHDGDLDIALTNNNGPAVLLRNDGGNSNNWLRVKLVAYGIKENNDCIGARVTAITGNLRQLKAVRSGSSYCSQSELSLTFGLGQAPIIDELIVKWPSGKKTKFKKIDVNQTVTVSVRDGLNYVTND